MSDTRGNIRPAASVLVLRDGTRGMELLLMRRPERDNDFRSGACVFPGGVLDRSDADAHRFCLGLDDAAASARLGLPAGGLDYFVAALRECFEEVGLLFACTADGGPADLAAHAETLRGWRQRLHRGEASLAQICAAFDWRLDLREMAYFSHWLTPVVRPKRFDTRFFVRLAPPQQQAQPDMGEALELMWLTPDEALDPARGLKLLNVTQRTLHDMRGFADAHAAFAHALALRGVTRTFPRPALGRSGPRFVIESDPAYAEVAHLDPNGRGDVRCELQAGDLVRLSPRLQRVAGAWGHAYIVTDTNRSEAAIVDADPADAAQWRTLCEAAPAGVSWLLATGNAPPGEAVQRQWPTARVSPAETLVAMPALRIGTDTRLRALGAGEAAAWLLEDDATLLTGADKIGALHLDAASGVEWLAGARGFLQRFGVG